MSVLIIQLYPGIGDMLWMLPATRGLISKFGKATILCRERTCAKDWLSNESSIEDIFYIKEVFKLRKKRFDASCVLHESFSYSIIPYLLGVKVRMGFFKTKFINKPVADSKTVHPINVMKSLMKNNNIELGSYTPIVKDTNFNLDYPKPLIALGIGCSEYNRMLKIHDFKEIIDNFKGTFFLFGGKMDKNASKTLKEFNNDKVVSLVNNNISDNFSIMKHMDYYIGHDTGMMNLAASFGIPCYVFFFHIPPLNHLSNIHSVTSIGELKKICQF